jgi:7,8-dihydroneopterin 2',3'-cyclic phosphate phosphodiesterase
LLPPKLSELANKIRDRKLRRKVIELLKNPTFEIGDKRFSGLLLGNSPAGLSHHHCYPGGYVEHVISTANLALALCDSVEKVYRGKVNRDLVIAGVLLHDLFKPLTYTLRENGSYISSPLAEYLDHLSLAVSELIRKDFPLELVHIVSAHHGDYGPIKPRTIEALVCHLADLADSRLNGAVLNAASYLTRSAVGTELQRLTAKEAFEIINSKSSEGWKGVTKTVEKIRRKRKVRKP